MRPLRRTDGDRTYFLIADVEPAYEQAVRDLAYPWYGDGYGRAFPSDTPHLNRIYDTFQLVIVDVVHQTARAAPVPWEQAIASFLDIVQGHKIDWWLTGSAALAVRGLPIQPRDIDLVVAEGDAVRLGELLLDYLFEPVMPVEGWICRWFGRAFVYARMEWVGGVNEGIDRGGVSDAGPTAAAMLETVNWRDAPIRVPPLELQLAVSRRRGLQERATTIKRWLAGTANGPASTDGILGAR